MDQWRVDNARVFLTLLKNHYFRSNEYFRSVNWFLGTYCRGALPKPDHCAFRTLSTVGFGRSEAGRLFSALGYRHAGCIFIPHLHIASCYFEPPAEGMEKIFFSEILVEDFRHDKRIGGDFPGLVYRIKRNTNRIEGVDMIVRDLDRFSDLNLSAQHETIQGLLELFLSTSQFCMPDPDDFAWLAERPYFQEIASVVAYGLRPNHFTLLLKDPSFCVEGYTSMEKFSEKLRELDIPMKDTVEGELGSVLRQTSTRAVEDAVRCRNGSCKRWPSSYVEFIERGTDPETGKRFEGFLPSQAKALFKMTERHR